MNYLAFKGVNEGVPKLNGNFAIAFYDLINEELYLVRDRIGQRPLFYTIINDTLFFSSEVKSFLNIPEFDFNFDWFQIKNSTVSWSTDRSGTIWKTYLKYHFHPFLNGKIIRNIVLVNILMLVNVWNKKVENICKKL